MTSTHERFEVVAAGSRVRIHTFAEGLFAKLAHDLELVATVSGHALRDASGGATFDLELPIEAIEVVGARKGGVVDAAALSASDRAEILAKMRQDVFRLGAEASGVVRVTGELSGTKTSAKVQTPRGASTRVDTLAEIREDGGRVRVTLDFGASLSALGSAQVKGPMGAFRVKDVIQVLAELELERVGT